VNHAFLDDRMQSRMGCRVGDFSTNQSVYLSGTYYFNL